MRTVYKGLMVLCTGVVVMTSASFGMELKGEELAHSKIYKPTVSAVEKCLRKMGYESTIDEDGDLKFKINKGKWRAFVIFNRYKSSKKIWNLQVMSQFSAKKSHYDEMLIFANKWNSKKKFPKVSIIDQDSMRMIINHPVEYGFNPDEFETNVIEVFETAVKQIVQEADPMLK